LNSHDQPRWKAPIAEVYGANETANGELGYFIVGDGSPRSWRVKTRPPSFINFSSSARCWKGHLRAIPSRLIGSLNIVAAELDRYAPVWRTRILTRNARRAQSALAEACHGKKHHRQGHARRLLRDPPSGGHARERRHTEPARIGCASPAPRAEQAAASALSHTYVF